MNSLLLAPYTRFLSGLIVSLRRPFNARLWRAHFDEFTGACSMSQARHKPFPVPRKPYGIVLLTSQLSEGRRLILAFRGQMPQSFQKTLNTALAAHWVFYHEGLVTFQSLVYLFKWLYLNPHLW